MQRGPLGLVTIGDQPAKGVNEEIVRAAMASVLDLRDVIELVVDALDERALAKSLLVAARTRSCMLLRSLMMRTRLRVVKRRSVSAAEM